MTISYDSSVPSNFANFLVRTTRESHFNIVEPSLDWPLDRSIDSIYGNGKKHFFKLMKIHTKMQKELENSQLSKRIAFPLLL